MPDFVHQFKELAEQLSELVEKHGAPLTPYADPGLPLFRKLATEAQQDVISTLRPYVEVCAQLDREGHSLKDSPLLFSKMLRRLGLEARDEYHSLMGDGAIVEIYSRANVQIFRNMRFFEMCSYTLEDLCSRAWFELYWRDENHIRKIFTCASRIFGGELTRTSSPGIPRHLLRETDSACRLEAQLDFESATPLWTGSSISALFTIIRGECLNPRRRLEVRV